MVTSALDARITLEQMRGSAKRRRKERLVKAVLGSAAAVGLVVSIAIVVALIGEAVSWLTKIHLSWLWAGAWSPRTNEFDLPTIFAGTVLVAVIALAVAAPLGLGAAMYLSEYARPRVRRSL
jgi:phosphate transport system permease protein